MKMERILVAFLILFPFLGLLDAAFNLTASYDVAQNSYNVGEDVTIKCVITSDEQLRFGLSIGWQKKQDGEFVMVGRDEDKLFAPFDATPDKYNIGFTIIGGSKVDSHLKIMGIEAVDTGSYRCTAGYDKEPTAYSNPVILTVNPDAVQLSLSSQAPTREAVLQFNVGQRVTCDGEANSLSNDLSLVIKLQDNTEITQDFIHTTQVKWNGENGLKLPTTLFKLTADSWLPEKAGDNQLSCYFHDGDRQLAMESFQFIKKENVSINCTTNYKKPVRLGDTNVHIMCKLYHYNGTTNELTATWKFAYENDEAILTTGEYKHSRKAERTNDGFRLIIPRVTADMLSTGKFYNYEVTLYRKSSDDAIASSIFYLPTDATRNVYNKSEQSLASRWLLLSMISAVLVLLRS